jgi:hypothetical protein
VFIVFKIDQRIFVIIGYQDYIAASSAVAAGRPAVSFAAHLLEASTARAAVARFYKYPGFVNKHYFAIMLIMRFLLKSTVPDFKANSVSSEPMPILMPGLYFVPRCLMIILPAVTNCPWQRFTPNR